VTRACSTIWQRDENVDVSWSAQTRRYGDKEAGETKGVWKGLPQSVDIATAARAAVEDAIEQGILVETYAKVFSARDRGRKELPRCVRTTPAAIVRLEREIKAVLTMPETRKAFASQGVQLDYQDSAKFRAFIAREIASWMELVKKGNINLQ
jgi:hypothetical protein